MVLESVDFGEFHGISCSELIEGSQEGATLLPGDGEADTKAGILGELGRGWGDLWGHILIEVVERGDVEKCVAEKEFFFGVWRARLETG